MSAPVVIAEVVRSGFVEGHHYGSVVALAADGSVDWSVGDVTSPVLPRSSNKPLQAVGMVELGLDLPPDLLALACASHSGEPMHVEGARRILEGAGLDESALQTPPDVPLDDVERDAWLRAGPRPRADRDELLGQARRDARHLRRQRLGRDDLPRPGPPAAARRSPRPSPRSPVSRSRRSRSTGAARRCSRPRWSGWRAGFAALATAASGSAHLVAEAIRAHPEMVSGTRRDERTLLTAIPGAIGKAGAESCYAVALADGRAFALKTDDGGQRARPVVMAAALRRTGVDVEPGVDTEAVRSTGVHHLLGGGEPVGVVRAVLMVPAASLLAVVLSAFAAGRWGLPGAVALIAVARLARQQAGRWRAASSSSCSRTTHGLVAADLIGFAGLALAGRVRWSHLIGRSRAS